VSLFHKQCAAVMTQEGLTRKAVQKPLPNLFSRPIERHGAFFASTISRRPVDEDEEIPPLISAAMVCVVSALMRKIEIIRIVMEWLFIIFDYRFVVSRMALCECFTLGI